MKNSTLALTLSVFPGLGHIYNGKVISGLFYMFTTIGALFIALMFAMNNAGDEAIVAFLIAVFMYIISFIDMGVQHSKNKAAVPKEGDSPQPQKTQESERFYTIVLSLVPGLGHFQLGLMNRGLTLLAAFLGLAVMVFFVAVLTHRGEFLIFLAVLPIIWVYGFFDASQQLGKKQRGETLIDRTILEDFEMRREDGKKSKAIATFLSIFPGAGHLYLGLQRRGIQLMAAFLFSIYILDVLRLGIFLFLIPIIWFYSFFDGLQKASKYGDEPMEDTPIIAYLINHQKWVGIGLVALGVYYMFTNIFVPALSPILSRFINIDLMYWVERYFQTAVVCVLLIGGGIKLLTGSKPKKGEAVK
jgi:hypothetical protein